MEFLEKLDYKRQRRKLEKEQNLLLEYAEHLDPTSKEYQDAITAIGNLNTMILNCKKQESETMTKLFSIGTTTGLGVGSLWLSWNALKRVAKADEETVVPKVPMDLWKFLFLRKQ